MKAIEQVVSRREFLWASSAVVVSFALGAAARQPLWAQSAANDASATSDIGKPLDIHEVDSFLAFHQDGAVTIYTSKVDVGTGLRMAMSQMAAEELGMPVEHISIIEGDTAIVPDQGGTGGSTGVPQGCVGVRQAAATARQTILNLAAKQMNRPASELTIVGGMVQPASGGAGVSVATLIGGKRLELQVDPKASLQSPAGYTVVGKPLLRPDVPAKCTGTRTYLQDLKVPGMVHARVIHPPAMGATLVSVDETSIRQIPGVQVVRIANFLAVASSDEWAAVRAASELKAQWTRWEGLPGSDGLDRFVRQSAVDRDEALVSRGDSSGALDGAPKRFSATYSWPCQSHGSLAPSCAVADVREDILENSATVWTASQGTYGLRATLAKIFGIPEQKLRVIYLDGSGSYGTNGCDDVAADAFLLSRKLGKPVRVQWMREDEHGWDPKGPPQLLDLRAGLDGQGHLVAWETEMWLPMTVQGARPLLGVDAASVPQTHGQGAGQVQQNGDPPYAAPNVKVTVHWLKSTPLRPSNLRAPGKIANVFAVEGFTDEIAAASGIDAIEFRLRGLDDPRAIEAIKKTTEMIGWQPRPSPNPQAAQGKLLLGRGIAYAHYKQAENYVATAMEVAVDPASGVIHVQRVACSHDCGLVINPDGLRNQIEGCIVQTLSRAMHEEVKFDKSRVTSVNWASYPILKMQEVPRIEVALLDRPNLPPLGAGEAAAAPVAAALANAVFDAIGVRLRTAPFTPERVKAALATGLLSRLG
jgi:nicotinate dehydrogenase subunit B